MFPGPCQERLQREHKLDKVHSDGTHQVISRK